MTTRDVSKTRRTRRSLHPLVHLALALVVLGLLQGFIIKPFAIPSASMEPTLMTGDRVLVNRLAYVQSSPQPGDTIVFRADAAWGESPVADDSAIEYGLKWLGSLIGVGPGVDHVMAKRVLAVGGQTITCCDAAGRILVDASPIAPALGEDLEFVPGELDCDTAPASKRCLPLLTVPEGEIIVAGDNRANSFDSLFSCRDDAAEESCLITVAESDVIGTIVFRWAPLSQFGPL